MGTGTFEQLVPLPASFVDDFLDAETVQSESGKGTTLAFSPSPFTVPRGIHAIMYSRNVCKLVFVYPNDERSDGISRPVPGYPGLTVQSGQHSGKIVEFMFDNAIQRLTNGIRIGPKALAEVVGRRAMVNATVIASLLATIPNEIRDILLSGLRRVNPTQP